MPKESSKSSAPKATASKRSSSSAKSAATKKTAPKVSKAPKTTKSPKTTRTRKTTATAKTPKTTAKKTTTPRKAAPTRARRSVAPSGNLSVPKKPARKLDEVEVAAKEVKRPPRKEVVAAAVKTSGSSRPSNVQGSSSAERVARLNAQIEHEKIAERRKNSHGIAMDVVGANYVEPIAPQKPIAQNSVPQRPIAQRPAPQKPAPRPRPIRTEITHAEVTRTELTSDFSEEVHNDDDYLAALAGDAPETDIPEDELDENEDDLAAELEEAFPEDDDEAFPEEDEIPEDDYPEDDYPEEIPEDETDDEAYPEDEPLDDEADDYPEDAYDDPENPDEIPDEDAYDDPENLDDENAENSAPTEDEILNAFNDDDEPDEAYNRRMPRKSKAPKEKSGKFGKILSKLIAIVATGSMGYLAYAIYMANDATHILAVWQLALAFLALGAISFLLLFKAFRGKTRKVPRIIFSVLGAILTAVSWVGVVYINDTLAFLNRNLGNDENVSVYNVIVNKSSDKNSLSDLKGGIIYAQTELAIDSTVIAEAVQKQANASVSFESDLANLKGAVMGESSKDSSSGTSKITSQDREGEESTVVSLSGETSTIFEAKDPAVMIHEDTYKKMIEEDSNFSDKTKVIGQITIRTDISTTAVNDITTTPFIVYISGIDTRTNDMPERSLSDVNMLAVVNPKTRNLLLVSIPRDYYVTIHGTSSSGLKDKLTHAGGLGGVQLSLATIEDFMDVDVNYYARVNFNFLEKLVDAVGGITLYSDTAFTAWTDHYCKFTKGNHDVDGRCALAFARERHAYSTGDRHRGENQEQVIKLILEKATQSSTILSKYSDILSALDGTFETDFNTNDVGEIVKMHMNDMTPWTVTSANLDGRTGTEYVYSSPSQALSVMYPDKNSIKSAQQAIKNVMEGRAADDDGDGSSNSKSSTNSTNSTNSTKSTNSRK